MRLSSLVLSAGYQRKRLQDRVETFMEVWNGLRAQVLNSCKNAAWECSSMFLNEPLVGFPYRYIYIYIYSMYIFTYI